MLVKLTAVRHERNSSIQKKLLLTHSASGRSFVWFCEEWSDSPDRPTTFTFGDCQVPPTLSLFLSMLLECTWQLNHFWTTPRELEKTTGVSALWIRNISDDLWSFKMELTDAIDTAQNHLSGGCWLNRVLRTRSGASSHWLCYMLC